MVASFLPLFSFFVAGFQKKKNLHHKHAASGSLRQEPNGRHGQSKCANCSEVSDRTADGSTDRRASKKLRFEGEHVNVLVEVHFEKKTPSIMSGR